VSPPRKNKEAKKQRRLSCSHLQCSLAETKKTCHAILFDAFWQKQRRPVLQSSSMLFGRNKEDLSCNPLQCSLAEAIKKRRPALQSFLVLFGRSKEEKKTCPVILFNALWQKQ
jgi:hypothetical protein